MILTGILISCGPKKVIYNKGIYEGIGEGQHGPIKVEVVTDEYTIMDIKIIEQQETPVLSDIVFEKIPERVIKKNSANVDVVAGATFTSEALLEAVNDALKKASIQE
tara:strand:+ start:112 stop:432 length:321 start_codon:yes stop_codon:yes gene_type:complete